MKYPQIAGLEDEKFRRLTGVKHSTFEKMILILKEADIKKKAQGGRRNKLCLEDQLLMALEYIREYRTYFHTSQSYGVEWFNETGHFYRYVTLTIEVEDASIKKTKLYIRI